MSWSAWVLLATTGREAAARTRLIFRWSLRENFDFCGMGFDAGRGDFLSQLDIVFEPSDLAGHNSLRLRCRAGHQAF